MILYLFEKDYNFAINKFAYSNLWKTQKLLFSKVHEHYNNVKTKASIKGGNIKNNDNVNIAKVVCFF